MAMKNEYRCSFIDTWHSTTKKNWWLMPKDADTWKNFMKAFLQCGLETTAMTRLFYVLPEICEVFFLFKTPIFQKSF